MDKIVRRILILEVIKSSFGNKHVILLYDGINLDTNTLVGNYGNQTLVLPIRCVKSDTINFQATAISQIN